MGSKWLTVVDICQLQDVFLCVHEHIIYIYFIHMIVAPKVILPILSCWHTTLEVDVCDITVEVEFLALLQIAAEWQSGKMSSDMEVVMKQRCVIEFFYKEKIIPIDI